MNERRTDAVDSAFASIESRGAAVRLGVWIFLASELLLFAGFFALYAGFRIAHPAAFHEAARHAAKTIGSINTGVLLLSSGLVAAAVESTRTGSGGRAASFLSVAAMLGVLFLTLKWMEYHSHIREGMFPAAVGASSDRGDGRLYWALYFGATGLHAVHVAVGIGLLIALARVAFRRGRAGAVAVETGGLYWHFVDLVWIFLWPLFYLAGR